jgi:opacity protein-like surface antigen
MHRHLSRFYLMTLLAMVCASSYAEDWDHRIGTYLLTINLDADTAVNTPGGTVETPMDLDFGSVIDNLNLIGVIYYQANRGPWTIDVDLTHAELEMDESFDAPIPPPPGPATATLKADMAVDEYEVFGGYRFYHQGDSELQFIFGARYYKHDLDIEVEVGPVDIDPSIKSSWTDPIVGFRYRQKINAQWNWLTRVDAGGFGMGSSSDLSYKVEFGASYDINENWITAFGYRYLYIDYEDGDTSDPDYYAYDGSESGLLAGIAYKF